MSIKILGGELKGLPLFVPSSSKTRPTSVLLKRRLFDSFQSLEGQIFCDLCAGIGSIGLEALSRGAHKLYAIETLHSTFVLLKKNAALVQEHLPRCEINLRKKTIEQWLPHLDEISSQGEITIFFDPPYENHKLYQVVLDYLFFKSKLSAHIWVESDLQKGPPEDFWEKFTPWHQKSFQQGSRIIYIFSKY